MYNEFSNLRKVKAPEKLECGWSPLKKRNQKTFNDCFGGILTPTSNAKEVTKRGFVMQTMNDSGTSRFL